MTYLEREILLQLAELFNLSLDLSFAPILDELLPSKQNLRALTFTFTLPVRIGGRFR